MGKFVLVLIITSYFLSSLKLLNSNDTMDTTQSVRYNDTLISPGQFFELGFFSPGNSGNWYLGIWYKNVTPRTVAWVANREVPVRNSSLGLLKIIKPGALVLLDNTNHIIWSSNTSKVIARNPVIQLLDSGNLVLRDANDNQPKKYLWQSFDYPTDTFLPGMTIGLNSVYLTSWKTDEDPSPGEYKHYLDSAGYPQILTKKAGVNLYRMGPWNGLIFSGMPQRNEHLQTVGVYRNKEGQFYIRDEAFDNSIMSRITLNAIGEVKHSQWVDKNHGWVLQVSIPMDNCDTYNICGMYGSCSIGNFPICSCLDKFKPMDPKGWPESDWSNGCIRRTSLNCTAGDGFLKYTNLKLPDAHNSSYNESITLEECKGECVRNCTCMAYTALNISEGGSGCLLYFGALADMKFMPVDDQDLYIRMAYSELDSADTDGKKNIKRIVRFTIIGLAVSLLGFSLIACAWMRKKVGTQRKRNIESHDVDLELPLFDLPTISEATNGFSVENKIGEGGYGPVYKGTLKDEQEIAVKRLSETSRQGLVEFKNEVIFVAKLQHRNLVKLLGCCIEANEKMLIYEYMPNKSLDTVLFVQKNETHLDWSTRLRIVNGMSRGLMYLHQDSRLRIIHRDLKASNILLDHEMNPKISDFGIAKRCRGNEIEVTSQIVGTYGYMSPEYAVSGQFSVKSDVFSFGVILLEIVSGKRNNSYSSEGSHLNLLAHAWTLHKEGRSTEVVDSYIQKSENLRQVLRLVHVGLLCVQQNPEDRPCMTSVEAMLSNDNELPQPDYPGFFMRSLTSKNVSSNPKSSTNEMTITMLGDR